MWRHKSEPDAALSGSREETPNESILHFSAKRPYFGQVPQKTHPQGICCIGGEQHFMLHTLLNSRQTQTLQALVSCIIPADDYPNGWDAGVGEYLAHLLTREPSLLFAYLTGLEALEAEAPDYSALPAPAKNALLARLEQDPQRGVFFRLLVTQVMEGFYADPGSGGNRDGIAWQMIGYKVTA